MNTQIFSNNLNKIIATLVAVGFAMLLTGAFVFFYVEPVLVYFIYGSVIILLTALVLDWVNDKTMKENKPHEQKS